MINVKIKELGDRTFKSKEELFSVLYHHQHDIIDCKKSQVYKSCEKGALLFNQLKVNEVNKSLPNAKSGFIYPIISTTNYLDTHKDVHFSPCFNKTHIEQKGKVKYILDHKNTYDNVLAWSKDVNMLVQRIDWALVGKNYEGQTEALIFEIAEENFKRKDVLNDIKNKVEAFENSISMVYYKIFLALNSGNTPVAEKLSDITLVQVFGEV
jgi:hypothetical protein